MKIKSTIWLSIFVLLEIFVRGASAADRPNVLLICVDDLKPMLGCYGDMTAKSPNIDSLAGHGVQFDRAYCNQAVCAPSRNSMLTGLRPSTIGIYDLGTNFRKAVPDAVTLPQYFKQNGYRTEGMGKIYHHGHGNTDDAASWSVPFWHGDIVHYVLKENLNSNTNSREAALFHNEKPLRAGQLGKGAPYEIADVPDNAYPDGQVAEEAIKRLTNAAKSPDQPFFIAVGFLKPHLPFCAPKKYWDMYDPAKFKLADRSTPPDGAPPFANTTWRELRNYVGMPEEGPVPDDDARKLIHGYHAAVSYMDAQLGKVIAKLDELGLAKNTIIVLWGDHGWHLGDHGMWCKHTNYEEAAHIPFIVVDPRAKAHGVKSESLVESVDLYPTLCQLAGLDAPKGLDGASFAKVLDNPAAPTKDAILHVYPRGKRIGRALRTKQYRLVEWKVPGDEQSTAIYELYDYVNDPGETKNIVKQRPELKRELIKMLQKYPEAKPQLKVADNRKAPKPTNIISRADWGSKADPIPDSRRHSPQWITIHHAGVLWTNAVEPAQFVRNMQHWGQHRPEIEQPPRNTYWPDLAYHFMIAPSGDIYEARPIEYEPESNTKYDLAGNLGIELMGDFEKQRPSKAQLESTVRLTAWLMGEYGISIDRVRTHRDAAPKQTSCPGRDFYRYFADGEFKGWVNRVLDGKPLDLNPGPPLTDPAGPTELITDTRPQKKAS
jgi:iduronate 2-sulfatase